MKKILFILFISVLIITACSSSDSGDDKLFSGNIVLHSLDNEDFVLDEVTILIYEESDKENWDYRLENPVAATTTGTNGDFSININNFNNKIAVVYSSDYSVLVTPITSYDMDFDLYQNIEISGVINYELTVNNQNQLVVVDDVIVIDQGKITVEAGGVIRLNPNKTFIVTTECDISHGSNLMSNDKVYSYNNASIDKYRYFELSSGSIVADNLIYDLKMRDSEFGLKVLVNNISVENSSFVNCSTGLFINNTSNNSIINSIFINISGDDAALYLDFTNNCHVNNCYFSENNNGIKQKISTNLVISNNIFSDNEIGIQSYSLVGEIRNNNFLGEGLGLYLVGNSSLGELQIQYNNFYVIEAIYERRIGSYNTINHITMNYNNFYDCDYFFTYSSGTMVHDINAENNYFDGLSEKNEIMQKIINQMVDAVNPIFVDIEPFRTQPIGQAGPNN